MVTIGPLTTFPSRSKIVQYLTMMDHEMREELPAAFDLTMVARKLLQHRKTERAGRAIEHMVDAHSAHADMQFAYEIMIALNDDARHEEETGKPLYTSVERGALFSQAVIYYARATIVSGSRRRSDLTGKLSEEQQLMHEKMEEMRHAAFAHFYKSASYKGNDFAIELPVWVDTERGPSLRVAIKRMVLNEQMYGDVLHQIKAMLAVIDDHLNERSAKAYAALSEAMEKDPKIARELRRHPFSAESFFGDVAVARDFLTTRSRMTQAEVRGDEAEILTRR